MNASDKIANLQLLEQTGNLEKNNQDFKVWLEAIYPDEIYRNNFLNQNLINSNLSLEFIDFLTFINARKQKIKNEFMKVFGVKQQENNIADEAA